IYPAETPGGWHIIGHTNTPLFDSTHSDPCLFKPGDTLSFVSINTVQGA
ncbi:MAG TPA: allophanate hydrolase, partial [Pseudoalteromonas sp.]|nr:allophanate hydrolase [Pseudoalteromonas sp.]